MVLCPVCNTENRDIAKFCIECVNALPTGPAKLAFAPTQRLAPEASGLRRSSGAPTREPRALRVGIAAFVVVTIAVAAGWYIYQLGLGQAQPPAAVASPLTVAPPPAASTDALIDPPLQQQIAQPAPIVKPAKSPAPVAAAEPRVACSGLNFIVAARCMAEQCAKPKFKPHAQCEAVRRQQRLEEEKRNPTLIN